MEVKSIFNNVLEITVGYSIFNYPDSIAIIVFLDYKKNCVLLIKTQFQPLFYLTVLLLLLWLLHLLQTIFG
ncbi:hypothetical protein EQH16_07310 [Streptococcus pneumoniae]|nr:hypothetical protein CHL72_02610 [Streptococcus pneumoniae]UKP72684.1 hypothetical protein EQH16_07310 [Streptococcus pneumoniae]UKP74696.1 hypothetical protein EQH15_07050 [Streptococcus pneumoniae]